MRSLDRAVEQAKVYKGDFMQGHGKGNSKDNMVRQVVGNRRLIADVDVTNLYASNMIVQNIIDIPAEDMTRNWFTLQMEDAELAKQIMQRLEKLNAKEALQKMISYERLRGDGFVSLGVTQSKMFDLEQPIDERSLLSLDYLHAFSSTKVTNFYPNEDMFSPTYGEVECFQINRRSRMGTQIADVQQSLIHRSRLLHYQTRYIEDSNDYRGQSLIEPLYDILTVLDTSLWSVGQILYDYTFKVYKGDGVDEMTTEQQNELSMILDYMFRTEALALIGKEDELSRQTLSVSGISELLDYVWDYLAGAVRMPKSIIKGQESGTITGAQYDVMNYYSRIVSAQENKLKPYIRRLVDLLLWAQKEPGGQIDPRTVSYEIKFNPLWNLDDETDAKIRKMNAETDEIYVTSGVLMADEVRAKRFGLESADGLQMSDEDWQEAEEIAKKVGEAYEQQQQVDI